MKTESLNLQQLIDQTIAAGKTELSLPAGCYRVPSTITIKNVDEFAFDGNGATLIMPTRGELLAFFGVKRITVKNLSVDCDPLPFTQGTINKLSDDHKIFEYEIHPGYPTIDAFSPNNGRSGIFVFNPQTLRWRQDVPDLYTRKSKMLSPTQGKVVLPGDLAGYQNIRLGDYVAFKNMHGNAFLFKDCGDVTLENVTVFTAPGAAFLLRTCDGRVNMKHCRIMRGPKPPGATHERLLSSVADGFNLGYSRKGVIMEDCDFSNMGDDSVNLHGTFMNIVAIENTTTILLARAWSDEPTRMLKTGDPVTILDGRSFAGIAEAALVNKTSVKPPPDLDARLRKEWKLPPNAKLFFIRLKLAKPVNATAGNKVELPSIACPDFVFRNNYFHDHRARGLRLGASHGVIENNRFDRIKSTAISLGPHAIYYEGGWVQDITVRGNSISNVCFDERSLEPRSANAGAIVIQHFLYDKSVPYVQGNADIRILDNTIDNVGGAGILATSVRGLTIKNNTIINTQQCNCDRVGSEIRLKASGVISLNYSENIEIGHNKFTPKGPYCREDTVVNKVKEVQK